MGGDCRRGWGRDVRSLLSVVVLSSGGEGERDVWGKTVTGMLSFGGVGG